MKLYVASSWRNEQQPSVVAALREAGHEVYDFRNPEPGDKGFHWSEIDPNWQSWTAEQSRKHLRHPIAERGFIKDRDAMAWCDACVLVLPAGRSAHLEAGWCAGNGVPVFILLADGEPELMYRLCHAVALDVDELVDLIGDCEACPIRQVDRCDAFCR